MGQTVGLNASTLHRARALWWLLPLLSIALAYLNSPDFGLLSDADFLIAQNAYMDGAQHLWANATHDYFWSSSGNAIPYWRPLTKMSWNVEATLFGRDSGAPFQVMQVLWLLLATAGVMALGRALGLARRWAALAGLFFGLHPAVVEPACLVMARSDLSSAAGVAWSLTAWMGWVRTGRRGALLLHLLALAVALGSKESAVIVAPLVTLWAAALLRGGGRRGEAPDTRAEPTGAAALDQSGTIAHDQPANVEGRRGPPSPARAAQEHRKGPETPKTASGGETKQETASLTGVVVGGGGSPRARAGALTGINSLPESPAGTVGGGAHARTHKATADSASEADTHRQPLTQTSNAPPSPDGDIRAHTPPHVRQTSGRQGPTGDVGTPAKQEARTPAEQEARTPAEQEARTPAEQEARTPAEQETRPPAKQEARTPAEQEARTPGSAGPMSAVDATRVDPASGPRRPAWRLLRHAGPAWLMVGAYLVARSVILMQSRAASGMPLAAPHLQLDLQRLIVSAGVYLQALLPLRLFGSGVHNISLTEASEAHSLIRGIIALGLALGAAVWAWRTRRPHVLGLLLWIGGSLAPVLLIEQLNVPGVSNKYPLADRWLLQAVAAGSLVGAQLCGALPRRWERRAIMGLAAAWAGWVISQAPSTHGFYRDQRSLLALEQQTFDHTPLRWRTHEDVCRNQDRLVGRALRRDVPEAALGIVRAALHTCGPSGDRRFNELAALVRLQRWPEARAAAQALAEAPTPDTRNLPATYYMLGKAALRTGGIADAAKALAHAQALGLQDCDLWIQLAGVAEAQGQPAAIGRRLEQAANCLRASGSPENPAMLLAAAHWHVVAGHRRAARHVMDIVDGLGALPKPLDAQQRALHASLAEP